MHVNRKPVVIEFMGVGGAGKSTLVAECRRTLARGFVVQATFDTLDVTGVLRHPWKWFGGFGQFFIRYMFFRRNLAIPGLAGLKEKIYLLLTRVVAHQYKLSHLLSEKADFYLLEHGPFTFRYDEFAQAGRELRAHSLWADAVIILQPSREVALARIRERGIAKGPESRAISESIEYREAYWNLVNEGIRFAKQSSVPHLMLGADRPTKQLTSEALAFIENLSTVPT